MVRGIDNDGDGDVDHPADPACLSQDSLLEGVQCGVPHRLRERAGRCWLGLRLPILAAARRRRRQRVVPAE